MRQRGFTIVELMITVSIAVILLGLGLVSFSEMLASAQTKSAAESLLSGLRMARSEAIKRNAPMRFQMVSDMETNCTYSSSSALWVVSQFVAGPPAQGYVAGNCEMYPYIPPDQPDICDPDVPPCSAMVSTNCRGIASASNTNPVACTSDPLIAYKSEVTTTPTVLVAGANSDASAVASVVTFNPLGRVLVNAEGSTTLERIDITSTNADAKPWRILINGSSGSMKICDPGATAGTPGACS